MTTVKALEAKTKFSELLDRAARGEEFIITKHDRPVARLVPDNRQSLNSIRENISKLREARNGNILNPPGKAKLKLKTLIEEGRR